MAEETRRRYVVTMAPQQYATMTELGTINSLMAEHSATVVDRLDMLNTLIIEATPDGAKQLAERRDLFLAIEAEGTSTVLGN